MTEVIAYLIEHFQDFDTCPPPEDLGMLLEEAGFDTMEIGNTLMMMEVLLNSSEFSAEPADSGALRVYSKEETDNLPQEVMGLMQYLIEEKPSAANSGNHHPRAHAHSGRRNYRRYRQSADPAAFMGKQERAARVGRRRADERALLDNKPTMN